MNINKTQVPAEFGPETRFELRPAPPAPFRATQETEFERLKEQAACRSNWPGRSAGIERPLRRAANEAAALAWVTFYPLLVFPVLFEEKTRTAISQHQMQTRILAKLRGA